MVTQAIELNAREIRIYNDKEIQLEVETPPLERVDKIREGLSSFGWKLSEKPPKYDDLDTL